MMALCLAPLSSMLCMLPPLAGSLTSASHSSALLAEPESARRAFEIEESRVVAGGIEIIRQRRVHTLRGLPRMAVSYVWSTPPRKDETAADGEKTRDYKDGAGECALAVTALKSRQSLQKAVADSMDVDALVTTDGSMDLKVQDALLGLDINLMHTNMTNLYTTDMFLGIRQRDPDAPYYGDAEDAYQKLRAGVLRGAVWYLTEYESVVFIDIDALIERVDENAMLVLPKGVEFLTWPCCVDAPLAVGAIIGRPSVDAFQDFVGVLRRGFSFAHGWRGRDGSFLRIGAENWPHATCHGDTGSNVYAEAFCNDKNTSRWDFIGSEGDKGLLFATFTLIRKSSASNGDALGTHSKHWNFLHYYGPNKPWQDGQRKVEKHHDWWDAFDSTRPVLVADAGDTGRRCVALFDKVNGSAHAEHGDASGAIRTLAATSTSCSATSTNARLYASLHELCRKSPTVDVFVNIFDANSTVAGTTEDDMLAFCFGQAERPPCLRRVFSVAGHKATFWRQKLTPERMQPYGLLWAFDNDMLVGDFDFERTRRIMLAADVQIAQPLIDVVSGHEQCPKARLPRVKSAHMLWASGEEQLFLNLSAAAALTPNGCEAQAIGYVENQAPLITVDAWRVLHTQMLSKLDMSIFNHTNWGICRVWCNLVADALHRSVMGKIEERGPACAVLAPPLKTINGCTIEAVGMAEHARSAELAVPWMIGHPYLGKFYANASWERHRQGCVLGA